MTTELKIGNSIYKISCPENESKRLLQIGEILDKKFKKLASQLNNSDEKTLLVYLSLSLQAELTKANYENKNSQFLKSEEDIYDAVSENIDNIAQYIEQLDKKIAEY